MSTNSDLHLAREDGVISRQLIKTHHARRRQAQRAVSDQAIEAALNWGRSIRQRKGRIAYHLDRGSIASAARADVDLRRHAGTAVVVAEDGVLVTVLRCSDTRRLRRMIK